MIPASLSSEAAQDSGAVLAVHPDRQLMAGAAFNVNSASSGGFVPLFLSTDGGWSWEMRNTVPAKTVAFQWYSFSGTGRTLYGTIMDFIGTEPTVSVIKGDPTKTDPEDLRKISNLSSGPAMADSPVIVTRAAPNGDLIYVGQNYFGGSLGNQTASVRVSTDGGEKFRLWGLETRPTNPQDGPSVVPAVARDGTVYVAFEGWRSQTGSFSDGPSKFTGDIVVCRDDNGAKGSSPSIFQNLRDPSDHLPGRIVAHKVIFPFSQYPQLGQQRIGASLAVAVHLNVSSQVYLAWADLVNAAYTIHVRRSQDRGQTWSGDLRTIPSATNPGLAIAEDGTVGLLYQRVVDPGNSSAAWETHFEYSNDGEGGWEDILLNRFSAASPRAEYQPYLSDRGSLMAAGNDFYGVFSASNNPDPNSFPQGVIFQRRHRIGKLLPALTGAQDALVPISIDPYFFHIKRVPGRSWYLLTLALGGAAIGAILLGAYFALRVRTNVEKTLEAKIRGPVLANYSGFIAAWFANEEGQPIGIADPGAQCFLLVKFSETRPDAGRPETIDLRGGEDAKEVMFKVSIDANGFEVPDQVKTAVAPRKGSVEVRFRVTVPVEPGNYAIFVQAFQKTRLVQVASAMLQVAERV
jgi:hypothetical protein